MTKFKNRQLIVSGNPKVWDVLRYKLRQYGWEFEDKNNGIFWVSCNKQDARDLSNWIHGYDIAVRTMETESVLA